MHCVAETGVRYWDDKNTRGVRGGYTHLDTEYVTTPIWKLIIRDKTCTDGPFGRTHEAISHRFLITDDTLGVGVGWTRFLRSIDMQKPTAIPAFAIPCIHLIRQYSGI